MERAEPSLMISATILLRLRIAVFLFAAFTAGCLDDEARGLAWAPDGHALAWVEGGSVVVHDFVTSTRTVAEVSPPADELAWLPDGLIAVVKGDDDSWDLARLSADADVAPFLTGPARVAAPLVSRDGSRAVCVEFTDDGGRILQLVDAAPEPLNDLHGDQRPLSLSDDGRYLIWVRHDAGPPGHAQRDLWVHDFRLSLDWRLTEDVAVETLARWLPRSNAVLYAAQTGASASIHVVDIVDPKPKRLWRGEGVITDLEWTPDGHQVLFCNAGTLHRMTDRGRDVRTLDTFPFSMHDVALSPDGAVIAVSGAGGPVLLDSDWTNPRLLDGTRDEQLDLRIALAAAQEGKAMRESFNSLVGSTRNPQERMRILKRFGEELALDGDHDEAIRQFTRGLSVADPPDPEFHRLIAEEFMLAWGDFDRARIALENHHSERIDRTPSSERPPTESFALRVLRTREPAAMKPYAEMQRARRDGDWTDAADAFGALLLSAPEFADDLRSEGFAMLGEAQSGLPRSAEGIIDLAEVLPPLVENVEDRVALEKALVNAQLVQGHWSVAAEAMGVAARRRAPDAFDTFQAEAAEALLAHTLCQAQGIALYGEHPGDAVARVWGSEAIGGRHARAAPAAPRSALLRCPC
jgi:hypothetical protein